MAHVRFWTPEKIAEAQKLCSELGSFRTAILLNQRWRVTISDAAVRNALRSAAIRSASLPTPTEAPLSLPTPTEAPLSLPTPTEADPNLLAFQNYTPAIPTVHVSQPANTVIGDILREVIIPDVHIPHHDRLAWACALGVLKEWKPHRVMIVGDFLDLSSLSRHPKARPDLTRLASELYAGNLALDELQNAAPDAEWVYLEGNHERRAIRFANELGSLDGLLTIPEQLFINDRPDNYLRRDAKLRGMSWIPYEKQPYLTPWSAYTHGHNSTAKHHAFWHAEVYSPAKARNLPIFYGHMHTFQSARAASGSEAHCVGFLGDPSAPELAYPEGRPTPWCHGLMILEADRTTNIVTHTPVRIVHGRAIFHGKIVAAT